MHHHHRGKTCRLSTQTAGTQMDRLIAGSYGLAHLVDREIALGTYEHQGVLNVRGLSELIKQIGTRNLLVAMGNILATGAGLTDEIGERRHLVELWHPSLAALLGGGNSYLLDTRQLDLSALRELTIQEGYFVDAHLDSFLYKPLHAVHHLCRSNGQMNMAFPLTFLRQGLHNLIAAMVRGSLCHLSTIVVPYPIHQEQHVAHLQPQHTDGVLALIGRQLSLLRGVWNVEIMGLSHFFSGWNTRAKDTPTIRAKAAKMNQQVVQSPNR